MYVTALAKLVRYVTLSLFAYFYFIISQNESLLGNRSKLHTRTVCEYLRVRWPRSRPKLETSQSREKRTGELIFSIVFRFVANRLKHLFIGRV